MATFQNSGSMSLATFSIAARFSGLSLFQASRFTPTWSVGIIHAIRVKCLVNSQTLLSTPVALDVVMLLRAPEARRVTASDHGSWTGFDPSLRNRSVPFLSEVRIFRRLRSSRDRTGSLE